MGEKQEKWDGRGGICIKAPGSSSRAHPDLPEPKIPKFCGVRDGMIPKKTPKVIPEFPEPGIKCRMSMGGMGSRDGNSQIFK